MDLSEICGACEIDQLLSFGWPPNKALHLGREDDIDLVLPDEFDQTLKIRTLFFGVLRRTDIILFEDDDDLNPQAAILGVALDFLKAFGNLN